MKSKILILEDSNTRIKDIEPYFQSEQCEIVWKTSVKLFITALEESIQEGSCKLVIFDHDLGLADPNMEPCGLIAFDPDGLTGADAADMSPFLPCPAIIWSWNDSGALNIRTKLKNKCKDVHIVPFNKMNIVWKMRELLTKDNQNGKI